METWRNKLKNWKCFSTSIEGFTDAVKPAEDSVVISIVIFLSVSLFASVYKYKSVTHMTDKRYLNLDPDVTCQ